VPLLQATPRVGTLVPVAVGTATEAFAAVGAGEGFLTSVGEPVPVVVGAPGESFAADAALVGFLAPVKPPVPLQAGWRAKPFATLGAGVRPARLGSVGTAMSQQGRADGEALPALAAAVWPLAGVYPAVPIQVGADGERPPALAAAERPLASVDAAMAFQVRDPAETLPARPTWVGFAASSGTGFVRGRRRGLLLPGVGAAVLGQRRTPTEAAFAIRAGVRPLAGVDALVFEEVGALAEAFPALVAAVGPRGAGGGLGTGRCRLGTLVLEALRVRLVVQALAAVGTSLGGWRGLFLRLPVLLILGGSVGTHVAVEVGAPGEGSPTFGALEGLLAGVDASMPLEVGAPGEGFPTHPALVGFPTQVALLVPVQSPRIGKAASALGATVGFLPSGRVGTLVGEQGGADAEASPAVGAGVGPLARVDALVDGEVRALDEALAAVGAFVRAVAGVDLLVLHQGRFVAEGLPALAARVAGLALARVRGRLTWSPTPARLRPSLGGARRRLLAHGFYRVGLFLSSIFSRRFLLHSCSILCGAQRQTDTTEAGDIIHPGAGKTGRWWEQESEEGSLFLFYFTRTSR